LVAVRVARDAFAEINFEDVDPLACLEHLSAVMSRNPTQCVPVTRFPEC
jgi:hypothetical protein